MAALYILAIIIMVKRDPSLAPGSSKCSWAERFKSLRHLVGIAILFLIVLGGMFSGFFTVNEAAAIGALASLVLMFFRHSFTWKNFYTVIMDTITTSGMVLLLVIGASIFGSFLGIVCMMLHIAADVLLRKFSSNVIVGSYEMVQYLLMTVIFASFPYAQTMKKHVRVTIFLAKLP